MATPIRWRSDSSARFSDLTRELEDLGERAAADPKALTDLRSLRQQLHRVLTSAEADSPAVAERRRQGRISYLEGELSELRGASA